MWNFRMFQFHEANEQEKGKSWRPELIHLASDVPGEIVSSLKSNLRPHSWRATHQPPPLLLCINTTHKHSQDTFPNTGYTRNPELSPKYNSWYWFWKTGKLLKREAERLCVWAEWKLERFKYEFYTSRKEMRKHHLTLNFHFSFPKRFSKYFN